MKINMQSKMHTILGSLVLLFGILSAFPLGFIGWGSVMAGVPAFILGIYVLIKAKEWNPKGMAIIGMVSAILGIAVTISIYPIISGVEKGIEEAGPKIELSPPIREEGVPKKPSEVPVREITTKKSKYTFEINGIKTADRLIHKSGEPLYIRPDQGYKFIVVNATLKNVGMRKEYVSIDTRLVVDKGYEYESYPSYYYVEEYGSLEGTQGSLRPTESITGTFAYEILENTVPAKLIIQTGLFTKTTLGVIDLTPYKIGKIKYKSTKVSIIDYEVDSYYYERKNTITIGHIHLKVKNKRKIPAIIKFVQVSVAGFQGKGIDVYGDAVEIVNPNEEEKLLLHFGWKDPHLKSTNKNPTIKPGVYTITFKILGLEDEVLATKSFSHHFKAE